jgi:WhiB family redox-sensing transcriptional regulator
VILASSGVLFWAPKQGAGSDWMDLRSPAWTADAGCREHRELEFVLLPRGVDPADVKRCRAVCRGCLVRKECLAYAMSDASLTGIWGGTTDRERRRLRTAGPSTLGPTNRSA